MGRADSISKKVNPRRQPASALSWTASTCPNRTPRQLAGSSHV